MASRLALFGIVVGIALLLSGLGFAILAIGGALRNPADRGLRFVATVELKLFPRCPWPKRPTPRSQDMVSAAARRSHSFRKPASRIRGADARGTTERDDLGS